MSKVKNLYGLSVGIPEPKTTTKLDFDGIYRLIEQHYKQGGKGREYNQITTYTNAIHSEVFKKNKPKDDILIKYSYVRLEWVKAALKYKEGKDLKDEQGGLVFIGSKKT